MLAALGTSVRMTVDQAAREAVRQVRRRLGGRAPDAALVVATAAWGTGALADLVAAVADEAACPTLAGGSVDALLAGEGWVAHRPALAVLGLLDVDAIAVHAEALAGDEARAGPEFAAALAGPPARGDLLILFADGLSLAPAPLLEGLARALPGLPIVGVGASEPLGGPPRVWADGETTSAACAGLLVRAAEPPAVVVTQGCRVVGPVLEVTRSRGHWVSGLDGRPALDLLDGARPGGSLSGGDAAAAPRLIGLLEGDDPEAPLQPPSIRRVVGTDASRRAFALPECVRPGTRLVVLEPDPEAAERDVERRLGAAVAARGETAPTAFGLHLTCRGAGDLLLEGAVRNRALAHVLAGAPLLGMAAAYPIAPGGQPAAPPRLHTYSGVVALVG
jgi:small ligand-binding sensory domain FIST